MIVLIQQHVPTISHDTLSNIYTVVFVVACVATVLFHLRNSERRLRKSADKIKSRYDAALVEIQSKYDESLSTLRTNLQTSSDKANARMDRTALAYEAVTSSMVRDLQVGLLRSPEDYLREMREFVQDTPERTKAN